MNKSLKLVAAVALMAAFAIVAAGPAPFPPDDSGPVGPIAAGPAPFPPDDSGPVGPLA